MTALRAWLGAMLAVGLTALMPSCAEGARQHGVVTGLLVEVGGPGPPTPHMLVPGHVTATGRAATKTVIADRHGRFRFSLPAGVYHLTGQSGGARCGRVRAVRVQAGVITRKANVICQVP